MCLHTKMGTHIYVEASYYTCIGIVWQYEHPFVHMDIDKKTEDKNVI